MDVRNTLLTLPITAFWLTTLVKRRKSPAGILPHVNAVRSDLFLYFDHIPNWLLSYTFVLKNVNATPAASTCQLAVLTVDAAMLNALAAAGGLARTSAMLVNMFDI